ncbi:DEAD/DEAH box helicase [Nodosilinea sp. LEGE 07298]|uniref:DEAD/DEAH box helicase n=1 Tax=Nodosilinea sp. LEGE 07298 TaxID=2777970 RepID=UPI00187FC9AE|nr:DEAD/DEAH box helicase [Nodosilinea sp. LEGE 07298]MBE9109699.1 DEAD/DEAH box helicase [Nodosilinea sp. LEGE 07298]
MPAPPKAAALRANLVQSYQKLAEPEQELVQLYSIIYAPVGKVKLLDCLNLYLASAKKPKIAGPHLLNPLITRLNSKRLLVTHSAHGPQCHPLLVEIATRDAIHQGRFEPMVKAVQTKLPIRTHGWNQSLRYFQSEDEFLREVRIGLYRHDWDYIEQQFEAYYSNPYASSRISMSEVFELICNNPFDRDWFLTLKQDPDLYEAALGNLCFSSLINLTPATEPTTLLNEDCAQTGGAVSERLKGIWIEQLIAQGRLDEADAALQDYANDNPTELLLHQSWLSCLQGDYAQAIEEGAVALKLLKKSTGKRKIYFDTVPGLFLVVALIQAGAITDLKEAEGYAHIIAEQGYRHWMSVIYSCLEKVAQVLQGNTAAKRYLTNTPVSSLDNANSFETLIDMLCLYWVDLENAKERLPDVAKEFYQAATTAGYDWFALEAAELLAHLTGDDIYSQKAAELRQKTGIRPLIDIITPKQPWELSLTALIGLNPTASSLQTKAATSSEYRLAWFLTIYSTETWMLQPKEQKISVKGGWSKGRAIALKRLKNELSSFSYLTPQDRDICSHLTSDPYSYGYDNYQFPGQALLSLVGHPLVFWEDSPTTRLEVVAGEPALLVRQTSAGKLAISLTPEVAGKSAIALVKETPTRLKVIEITANHHRIAEVLGPKNALEVPENAKEQVLAAINAVAGLVTVHSDIGGGVADAEEVEAQPQPHLHLLPAGEGLKVSLLTRPFGDDGPYYRPGSGGEMVIAEIDGQRLQTHRNLEDERTLAQAVETACPTLQRLEDEAGEWLIDDPEACLELLTEIQDISDLAVVEWPEGEKMRIANRVSLSNFKIQIQRQRDWFAASGELQISDDEVLDMQRLMELLKASPSRFIKLADGQFLALTQEFRKRLDDLRAYSETSGDGVRFHPLAGLAMEDWMDEVGQLKTDKHWKDHLKRLKEAKDLKPELPSTLQAELRDYQIEGFNWLARLAHWGVGACLADDMGLGKTLQALAVILTRAPQGPTLIIAPTSVCMNWLSEAEKFAPTLNPIQFGTGDRQKILNELNPFDLVVCSYGLLQQDDVAKMLAQVTWQTIVLDEAQAIKNSATKRSKAAMKLQGGFKILTTGTPIENHLGELWNLFRFINPGLLGSQDQFSQRFANAIERNQDKAARNRLKKLIQPFILRRTKTQVLDELPARTEITLQVELSAQEMAFYEALRRDAIEKLADPDVEAGTKHLQVLAEIMKLRRACCNTRLVKGTTALPSAKLEAFGEIMEELLENNHKALVFSQFVDHLSILREFLDGQNISYQYLDGSTPAKDRKKRVDAFQAGKGDVFLISLKAGGTGLNLTAADYVIHMDPWWNPAVEDQASDRAHRIGQQRPVTIYRLVAKNTIEEKIVDLHKQKRDLADGLLEGADMSGKISTDQLLRLISEG